MKTQHTKTAIPTQNLTTAHRKMPRVATAVEPVFIGLDYHKNYSVYCVIDVSGKELHRGRILHATTARDEEGFHELVARWPKARIAFEATMNWQWLHEILEELMAPEDIVVTDAFRTRLIADAQVKNDRIDAAVLAQLLRVGLLAPIHIPARRSRENKALLRQRSFFVVQRTRVRNRIHRLLGAQHEVSLPQCSDLFGTRGLGFLEKLTLPEPDGLLLKQQLEVLKALQLRIRESDAVLKARLKDDPARELIQSIPGMGDILAAVVVNEIDDIKRFASAQKLCGYAGLCPTTHSSGGKTHHGKLFYRCNKWLRWAFVEAAWVAVGCSPYFGEIYKAKRARGKMANTAIVATARRMARIAYQLLTEERTYASDFLTQTNPTAPAQRKLSALPIGGVSKELVVTLRRKPMQSRRKKAKQISPAASV
jgi:transposase